MAVTHRSNIVAVNDGGKKADERYTNAGAVGSAALAAATGERHTNAAGAIGSAALAAASGIQQAKAGGHIPSGGGGDGGGSEDSSPSTPAPSYDRTVPNVFANGTATETQKPGGLPQYSYDGKQPGGLPQYSYDGKQPEYSYNGSNAVFEHPGEDAQLHQQYQNAMAALEAMKGKAPVYGSQYDAQIQDLYNQIMNRGAFKYDSKTDPLYQQYVQDYTTQGKMAMRDTMGQAAALTGGYGSTYAQSVGQQQYDQYLQRMADILPQTYGMALDAYNAQGNEMRQNLAMTQDLEQSDYARYLDALQQHNLDVNREQANADNWYERMVAGDERLYNRAVDEYNRLLDADQTEYARNMEAYEIARQQEAEKYRRQQDEYARNMEAYEIARQQEAEEYQRQQDEYARLLNENQILYDRAAAEEKTAYSRQLDQYEMQKDQYNRLMQLIAMGYTPSKEEYNAAGLSEAQGEALRGAYMPEPQTVYVRDQSSNGDNQNAGRNGNDQNTGGDTGNVYALVDKFISGPSTNLVKTKSRNKKAK